jgi:FkbM family methyltransferase
MGGKNLVEFIATHPLTRDHLLAALARLCAWQVRCLFQDEVIVPWVSGTKLAVRRGMTGATGNIYTGLHEFSDMAFTLHFLRPLDGFVDVGANVGTYTVLASGARGARTVAVEPDPSTMKHLLRNIEINGLDNLVFAEQAALGDHEGYTNFTVGLDTENHIVEAANNVQKVKLKTLDAVTASVALTMIKIDVEGYESWIFRGGKGTLHRPSLKVILSEGHGPDEIAPLLAAGFERYLYDPFGRILNLARMESPGNALFIRDIDWVRGRIASGPPFRVLNRDI